MAISRQVDLLEPINLAEHLDKVELYLGQVCQIAGISKMQLDYWTNKAQIPTKGKKQRIYDMDALETVMLIKQAKDKGLNLGAATGAREALPAHRAPQLQRGRRPAARLAPHGAASRRRPAASSGGTAEMYVPAPSSIPARKPRRGNTSMCQCSPSWSQRFSGTGPSTACSRRIPSTARQSASASSASSRPRLRCSTGAT